MQIAVVVHLAWCKLHFSCKVPGGATDSGQMATVTITVSRCYVIPHQMAHKPMKRCTGRPVAGEFGGRKRQLMNSRSLYRRIRPVSMRYCWEVSAGVGQTTNF